MQGSFTAFILIHLDNKDYYVQSHILYTLISATKLLNSTNYSYSSMRLMRGTKNCLFDIPINISSLLKHFLNVLKGNLSLRRIRTSETKSNMIFHAYKELSSIRPKVNEILSRSVSSFLPSELFSKVLELNF